MARVEELANGVQLLKRKELSAFRDLCYNCDSDAWDREIEKAVLAGRLDEMASEAIA